MSTPTEAKIITVFDWVITLIIIFIPAVNVVMLLFWAFSSGTNPSKANFAKAALLSYSVMLVVVLIIAFIMNGSQMRY